MRRNVIALLVAFAMIAVVPSSYADENGTMFDGSAGLADPTTGVLATYSAPTVLGPTSQVWDVHNFPSGQWKARVEFVYLTAFVGPPGAVICVSIEGVTEGCTVGLSAGGGPGFHQTSDPLQTGSTKRVIVRLRPTGNAVAGTVAIKVLGLRVCQTPGPC